MVRAEALAALALIVVASCSSSSSSSSSGAGASPSSGRSACSTGPDYGPNVTFPIEDDQTTYPTCLDRCVAGRPAPQPRTLETLPSGACEVEGERCSALIQYFCRPNGTSLGRVDGMRCSCTTGSWSCVTTSQGAGTCGPDGGTALSDSGSD